MNENIEKAVNILGGQTAAAKLISECSGEKVAQGNVWSWIHRTEVVPPHIAPYLESLTDEKGERIDKEILCPGFPWNLCCSKNCTQDSAA